MSEATIYEPGESPQVLAREPVTEPPAMTASRAILIAAVRRYLMAMLDPTITLLELHKLAYFIQLAGIRLKLNFKQAHYGPYAENLRFLLDRINHYYIEVDLSRGDSPEATIELVPSAFNDAEEFLKRNTAAEAALNRVFDLADGWETPHGLELLATVHWAAAELGASNLSEIVTKTYAWNSRKRQFSERQIGLAYDTLRAKGWL